MGLDSKELSLDLNCCFSSPNSFSDLLTEVSSIDDIPKKLSALNDYVRFLEQELRKVDVFKRELPLSTILLNDAIVKLKEEALQLKRRAVEEEEESDKKDWMSSAQLWTTPVVPENSFDASDSIPLHQPKNREMKDSIRSLFDEAGNLNKKGAIKREVTAEDLGVDGLSLSIPVPEIGSKVDKSLRAKISPTPSHDCGIAEDSSSSQQQSKKQRRCWSQELHQSFVNALLQLGGAQAATPKQIREIMQVDGLTNDEVKSHLQKYRLHIRKLQPSPADALPTMEHWLKLDENTKHTPLPPSGSPDSPMHLGGSTKGASAAVGESMDEDEDAKSESRSWKGRFCNPT